MHHELSESGLIFAAQVAIRTRRIKIRESFRTEVNS